MKPVKLVKSKFSRRLEKIRPLLYPVEIPALIDFHHTVAFINMYMYNMIQL